MTKNLFFTFMYINIAVIFICIFTSNYSWLINIEISFISSLIISMATYIAYKKNVQNSVDFEVQKQAEDLDYIDKIDDPYDLYSDDVKQEIIENPTKEQIQEAMKPIKQNHFANFKKGLLSYSSFYRIGAYIFLVIGFFYLNNNKLLDVIPYLLGFLIVPVGSLLSKRD
jgi:biopolymer transport protein ExbB/TolQ